MRKETDDRELLVEARIEADPNRLMEVRSLVSETVQRAGLCAADADDVAMAVNEAFANIIQHAYHNVPGESVLLRIIREPRRLIFLLKDNAPCVDTRLVAPRDLGDLRPGGLGVHFIRKIMSEMRFLECSGRGNTLEMTKDL